MKAGTTTLFDRLATTPGVFVGDMKEPHFFDSHWDRGVEWYRSLFEDKGGRVGEASASYADAAQADLVFSRMSAVIPDARLIYLIRHPIDRMRSHYRHEVLRARERRPFEVAVNEPSSQYLTRSLYGSVLEAMLSSFARSQILLVRSDAMDDMDTWNEVLDHVGVGRVPMPQIESNRTSDKPQFTPWLLWLWERGLIPERTYPRWLSRIGRNLLTRDPNANAALLESALEGPGDNVLDIMRSDQVLLANLLGDRSLVWESV
jgi:hypothetical protein